MKYKITKNEFKKKIPLILQEFEPSINSSPIEKKQRISQIKQDFWKFFEYYLPHYAHESSPEFHKEIISLLQSTAHRIAIAAPRGFAKSTIVSFAYIIWSILNQSYKFIILVSATDDLAEDLSNFIRLEFTDNKRIIEDFGLLLKNNGSANDFIVHNTRVLARGRQQALRGFRSREHRPDLIILDDIEKDNEAISPQVVSKTLDNISRGLIPSLTPNGKIVIVGTILRTQSVVGTILLSPNEPWKLWTRKIYKAIQSSGNGHEISLWETRFSLEFLQKQKKEIGISAFNSEYQNMPHSDDSSLFNESMLIQGQNPSNSPMVLFIDPSVDGIKKNDYKACILLSKHQSENSTEFCVEDGIFIQGSDSLFFEKVCELFKKYQSQILGTYCEANGFQIYFIKELERYAQQQKLNLKLSSIKNTLKKEYRIAQLVPLFETKKIVLHPIFLSSKSGAIFIEQLLNFPNTHVHDDAPDALAGAVKVLENLSNKSSFTSLPKSDKKTFRKLRF